MTGIKTHNIRQSVDVAYLDDALGMIMAASDSVQLLMDMKFTTAKGSDKLIKIKRLLHLLEDDASAKIKTMDGE